MIDALRSTALLCPSTRADCTRLVNADGPLGGNRNRHRLVDHGYQDLKYLTGWALEGMERPEQLVTAGSKFAVASEAESVECNPATESLPVATDAGTIGEYIMYSGTLKQKHVDFAALTHLVPDLRPEEMRIGQGVATVKKLPFEAPWMSPFGACLIMITSIRRAAEGHIEFQLGDRNAVPYENGDAWCRADDFYSEWPQ